MKQGLAIRQRLEAGIRIDPRLVLNSQIMQFAQAELEQAIEAELNENPALERLQEDIEPLESDAILESIAPYQLKPTTDDYELNRSVAGASDEVEWLDLAVGETSLRDHVFAELQCLLPIELHPIAHYAAECLDEKGYLLESSEEIALATNSSLEQVFEVVAALRKCEPAGIGATDLIDCLLLQLRKPDSVEERLARAILRDNLDEFLARKTMRIARRYGVMPDVVQAAFNEIAGLTPYPGERFCVSTSKRAPRTDVASPDVILNRTDMGWTVEVKGSDAASLCISRSYKERLDTIQDKKDLRDEKRHITLYVQRAGDFIKCLEQRKHTLRQIGDYLLSHQPGFVNTGNFEFLLPLTRTQLAHDLGIHESTISRATADKFIQLPTGMVVSFDVFFKPALRIQKMIEEILTSENPDNPLSDDQISELLGKKGVFVARRTVNKYRDRTKLLSSRKRKSA